MPLTLSNIQTYLNTPPSSGGACSSTPISSSYTIVDADSFLLGQMNLAQSDVITFNTSNTTNDNFLTLYNDQYARNTEAFVGILIISAILAKMIFYPIKI